MRTLRLFSFAVILCSLIGGAFFVPEVVQASDACPCFCTSSSGAVDIDKVLTSSDCSTECEARGGRVAAWACSANQYPSRSLNCFTSAQCGEHNGVLDDKYQPPECPTGMHYCYADPANQESVKLAVAIGDLTSTKDVGEYVSSLYIWLLGAMTTIAIVLLMVQGLRYSFGAMSASAVSDVKKKILTIVVGLTLLLSTALIVRTINPQLLNLSVPAFPLIKTVSLVDNASCDDLIKEGFKVDFSGPEECGTVGTVTEGPGGDSVPDGTVCNFEYCANAEALCVPGEIPTCMKCQELTADNGVIQVSESVCNAFNALPEYVKHNEVVEATGSVKLTAGPDAGTTRSYQFDKTLDVQQCFYTRDSDAGGEPASRGACAFMYYACHNITSCDSYANINVQSGTGSTKLSNIDLGADSGLTSNATTESLMSSLGDVTMGQVCQQDLCAWARTDNDKGCYIQSASVGAIAAGSVADIVSAASTIYYSCETTDSDSWWLKLTDF